MILNSADIPNLYEPDERGEILERMQAVATENKAKIEFTPFALYNYFIDQVCVARFGRRSLFYSRF